MGSGFELGCECRVSESVCAVCAACRDFNVRGAETELVTVWSGAAWVGVCGGRRAVGGSEKKTPDRSKHDHPHWAAVKCVCSAL